MATTFVLVPCLEIAGHEPLDTIPRRHLLDAGARIAELAKARNVRLADMSFLRADTAATRVTFGALDAGISSTVIWQPRQLRRSHKLEVTTDRYFFEALLEIISAGGKMVVIITDLDYINKFVGYCIRELIQDRDMSRHATSRCKQRMIVMFDMIERKFRWLSVDKKSS